MAMGCYKLQQGIDELVDTLLKFIALRRHRSSALPKFGLAFITGGYAHSFKIQN